MDKRERWHAYYEKHREEYLVRKKAVRDANLEAYRAKAKEARDRRKDRKSEYSRRYLQTHKRECADVRKRWRHENPMTNLQCNLRRRMAHVIRVGSDRPHSAELTGCTGKELRAYLESQFQDGMTWENYGSKWHVDHKRPIASFDLSNMEQVRACFYYTNLQPLWAHDNLAKGAK